MKLRDETISIDPDRTLVTHSDGTVTRAMDRMMTRGTLKDRPKAGERGRRYLVSPGPGAGQLWSDDGKRWWKIESDIKLRAGQTTPVPIPRHDPQAVEPRSRYVPPWSS